MKYTNEQTIDLRRELLCSLRLVLFVPQGHFTSRYGGSRAAAKAPAAAKGGVPQQPRRQTGPNGRPAFERLPRGVSRHSECGRGTGTKGQARFQSARPLSPTARERSSPSAGGKQSEKRARLSSGRRPCRDAQRGRRNLIGEGAPQAGAYEALSAKRARGTRSPSPRSPPKRVERSPLQTSRRNLPVTLSAQRATSDGVPAATIRPPASPPPGPISRI